MLRLMVADTALYYGIASTSTDLRIAKAQIWGACSSWSNLSTGLKIKSVVTLIGAMQLLDKLCGLSKL